MKAKAERLKGIHVVEIDGESMMPTLCRGDCVLVDQNTDRIEPGDIVAVGAVVHRVLWLDPMGGVWHCGDGNSAISDRAHLHEVQGRVVAAHRQGQWLVLEDKKRGWGTWASLGKVIIAKAIHKGIRS